MRTITFQRDERPDRTTYRREYSREYRARNKELIRRQQRAWYLRRRDYVLAKVAEYSRARRER